MSFICVLIQIIASLNASLHIYPVLKQCGISFVELTSFKCELEE